jgi:5'-nucleotidase
VAGSVRAAAVVAMVAVFSTLVAASDPGARAVGTPSGVAEDAGPPAEKVRAGSAPPAPATGTGPPVPVRVLAINDFHGRIEGAPGLAGRLSLLRTSNTVTVAAGDLVGASPLVSAAFHDEPAVEALDLAGLDLAAVGNHEFDEGTAELLRLQYGGCHPVDGCPDGPYPGAGFRYLAANVVDDGLGGPVLAPYAIEEVGGVRIGFIGMTLESTPGYVAPSGTAGVRFTDEVATGNAYARLLQDRGVRAIVVLLHEGGFPAGGGIDDCVGLSGPVVPIVEGLSDAVDVVITGHTHQAYNCVVDGRRVTSAGEHGRVVTAIDLTVDPASGEVLGVTAQNVAVGDAPPDPGETGLVDQYRALLGPRARPVVGTTAVPVTGAALATLVADAELAATRDQGAVAAFVHPDGLRADLDAGPVTADEALAVLPFNNYLVTLDVTGADLQALLDQGTLVPSSTVGHHVPVDPAATYRITVNDLLADGGGGSAVLARGTNRVRGGLDVEALADYLTG